MKTYKISICDVDFDLDLPTMEGVLTEPAFKLAKKVAKQGGELRFGFKSVKPELIK